MASVNKILKRSASVVDLSQPKIADEIAFVDTKVFLTQDISLQVCLQEIENYRPFNTLVLKREPSNDNNLKKPVEFSIPLRLVKPMKAVVDKIEKLLDPRKLNGDGDNDEESQCFWHEEHEDQVDASAVNFDYPNFKSRVFTLDRNKTYLIVTSYFKGCPIIQLKRLMKEKTDENGENGGGGGENVDKEEQKYFEFTLSVKIFPMLKEALTIIFPEEVTDN
jgi:hypothetical protein